MSNSEGESASFLATLGSVLKKLRLRSRLSGDQLSHIISRAYLRKLEAGRVDPGISMLLKLCEAYSVELSFVLIAVQAQRSGLPSLEHAQQILHEHEQLIYGGYLCDEKLDEPEKPIVKHRAIELRTNIRDLAAAGLTKTEIARKLAVSLRTVQRHLKT